MQAIRYHETGGSDVLRSDELERFEPGREEILVEVRAAGINPVDTKFRAGVYEPGPMPMIPGSDFAGVVTDVGPGIEEYGPGDRVFGTGLGIDRQGTCAEYTLATTDHLAHLPDGVSYDVGAAIALVGVTAFEALVNMAGLEVGERCLIHGGSGGVGHVAVQLAAAAGATVIATVAPEYHDRVQELGADAVFDYATDDAELAAAIKPLGPPDVVLDHRIDEHLGFNTSVGAPGSRVVAIDSTDPTVTYPNAGEARSKSTSLHNLAVVSLSSYRTRLERLARLLDDGKMTATIARSYELDDVAEAHRAVVEDSFLGKIVVEP